MDATTHSFLSCVSWVALDNGVDATTFAPFAGCTRAQVVTFLWRTVGCPEPQGGNPFVDVFAGRFFYSAVLWAAENGITNGVTKATFAPDDTCARGHVVTFLYRDDLIR